MCHLVGREGGARASPEGSRSMPGEAVGNKGGQVGGAQVESGQGRARTR